MPKLKNQKTTTVCVIPARGGSKRIPNKNIRPFAGEPIILYSIRAARECMLFDRIIVSTESEQIADIALQAGAEVPFIRPLKLSDDYTVVADILRHAIDWMRRNEWSPVYLCCIYATAPFIQQKHLNQGYEIVTQGKATRAFTVTSFPAPLLRALRLNEVGRLEKVWPGYKTDRSQDLPAAYYNAGQFQWYQVKSFMDQRSLKKEGAMPIVIPRYLAHDIDTQEDWDTAEIMYLGLKAKNMI